MIINGGHYYMPVPAGTQTGATFQAVPLGQNIFWVYHTAPLAAAGTAAGVAINVDKPFKLIAILVEHSNAAGAAGTDAFSWEFDIQIRTGNVRQFPIVRYTNSVISNFYEDFGDDYLFPAGDYIFIHNTTATDLINLVLVLQERKFE